ncbi:MAG: SRPBCC family protein [Actinomycetota bacterium]|nr:SRPBCC family protein [Actinomycetota bacterium]
MIIKPKHTMYQTTVLDAGADAVWAEVRDVLNLVKILFGDTVGDMTWVDGGSPDLVPSRYEFRMLHNGGLVQQQVAGRDEVDRSLTYRTTAPVLCLYDYVATYRVLPVTNDPGRSFFEYSREFMVTDDAEPAIVEALTSMMDNQISAVRDYFATPKQQ